MTVFVFDQDIASAIDPIQAEIIREKLQAIPDLVEADLTRTAFSPLIYEYKDYAVGMVDVEGRGIALARNGLPGFLASVIGRAVLDGIDVHGLDGIEPGDVLMTNYAPTIGQHANNVVMYTPMFDEQGVIVAFMSIISHWIDIGGRYPGSCSGTDTTDIFQEGLQLRSVRLQRRGEMVDDMVRIIRHNSRLPDMLMGDVEAQLAGCIKGRQMFEELLERHGKQDVLTAIRMTWAASERAVGLKRSTISLVCSIRFPPMRNSPISTP